MLVDDLVGEPARQRDVAEVAAQTKEAKKTRSYDSLQYVMSVFQLLGSFRCHHNAR